LRLLTATSRYFGRCSLAKADCQGGGKGGGKGGSREKGKVIQSLLT